MPDITVGYRVVAEPIPHKQKHKKHWPFASVYAIWALVEQLICLVCRAAFVWTVSPISSHHLGPEPLLCLSSSLASEVAGGDLGTLCREGLAMTLSRLLSSFGSSQVELEGSMRQIGPIL